MKSILQTEKECYITGRVSGLHKHHIFGGYANRKISDKNGFWVWLSWDIHRRLHDGFDGLDRRLKQECQRKFEETHTREEFRGLIGRNYI